ncbi:hypothetical protein MASR2M48_27820 [Spirochaetota bacterium]
MLASAQSGVLGASLEVADMPVPFLETVSFLSASANVRVLSSSDWRVVSDSVSSTASWLHTARSITAS